MPGVRCPPDPPTLGAVGRGHADVHRVAELLVDEGDDIAVEGGREQQRLAIVGRQCQQCGHVGEEPHVGHPVGLVDHGDVHLGERDGAPFGQLEQPTGTGDQHVDASFARRELWLVGDAAVHHRHGQLQAVGERLEHVGDLAGELACGCEHQCRRMAPRSARPTTLRRDAVEHAAGRRPVSCPNRWAPRPPGRDLPAPTGSPRAARGTGCARRCGAARRGAPRRGPDPRRCRRR